MRFQNFAISQELTRMKGEKQHDKEHPLEAIGRGKKRLLTCKNIKWY